MSLAAALAVLPSVLVMVAFLPGNQVTLNIISLSWPPLSEFAEPSAHYPYRQMPRHGAGTRGGGRRPTPRVGRRNLVELWKEVGRTHAEVQTPGANGSEQPAERLKNVQERLDHNGPNQRSLLRLLDRAIIAA